MIRDLILLEIFILRKLRKLMCINMVHIFFHTNNKQIWEYVNQFAEFNRFTNSPVANYNGELYSLPFNMYTFNKMWGVVKPEEAEAKIEEQKKDGGNKGAEKPRRTGD